MSTINERFREVRKILELSQDDFAAMANRTRSEIKNIEYSKTSPKKEVIMAVCAAHGINRKYLEYGELPKFMPEPDTDTDYMYDHQGGDKAMSTINERFREVRETLKLTQTEFATKANRTRSEISNIEYNKTSPKEEVIKAVCSAHNINRKYLEYGELPMLMPEIDEDTDYIDELLSELDNPFVDIIKSVMKVYVELSPADREKATAFARSLKDKIKENRD